MFVSLLIIRIEQTISFQYRIKCIFRLDENKFLKNVLIENVPIYNSQMGLNSTFISFRYQFI